MKLGVHNYNFFFLIMKESFASNRVTKLSFSVTLLDRVGKVSRQWTIIEKPILCVIREVNTTVRSKAISSASSGVFSFTTLMSFFTEYELH